MFDCVQAVAEAEAAAAPCALHQDLPEHRQVLRMVNLRQSQPRQVQDLLLLRVSSLDDELHDELALSYGT